MIRTLSALARSGLLVLGTLAVAPAPVMGGPISVPSLNIVSPATAAGVALDKLPFQNAVLIRPTGSGSEGMVQLIGRGGRHGGGGHRWHGGGGRSWHGGGGRSWHGGGGRSWHGGGGRSWHGGGRHWRGGGHGWHGGSRHWHGNNWRGNYWRGGCWNCGGWNDAWWGAAPFIGGLGLGLAAGGYGNYNYDPVYVQPRYAQVSGGHVQWCYNRYRSYRAYDNTFQPNNGPRRQCVSPYG